MSFSSVSIQYENCHDLKYGDFFSDFWMIFEHFLSISSNFEPAGARANARIGARSSKSQNAGSQKCNALSPVPISSF